MARVFPRPSPFAHHGGLTPPALGGSACEHLPTKLRPVQMHKRIFSKSGGYVSFSHGWRETSRCGARIEDCPATFAVNRHVKSGGRQPAVGTVSSRGWRTVIHRQAVALSRSGEHQPAVVRESHRQHRTLLAERGCSHTTGGLRPPLLVVLQYGHSPTKLRLVRCTTARLQERRASARRGNGVEPWMAIRNSPTAGRTQQEGQASTRRGTGIAPATASVSCQTRMLTCHGGLTPPALGCMCGCHCRYALRTNAASFPTGGLRPPLLAACADVIADTRFAPTSTHLFPRLAYASRSWCTASVDRKIMTFPVHKRPFTRAAGVSPPCERNASAMARVFPGASTFAHHGGLTPPALGCMCGCHCRYALRANEYASFPTAGLRQPLLVHGVGRPKNNDIPGAQTHVSKSGGRQPAVVRETIAVR
jgi:hypothetical protein